MGAETAAPSAVGGGRLPSSPAVPLRDGWSARCFRSWDFPPEVLDAWSSLAEARGDAAVFLDPAWFGNWWKAFGAEGALFVVALEWKGRTRALFPLLRRTSPGGKIVLSSLSNDHSFYYDFLLPAGAEEEGALSAFAEFLRRTGPARRLVLEGLSGESATGGLLQAALGREGFPVQRESWPFAPRVEVKGTWEEYERGLHPKLLNNLKKGRRRAEREGTLSFETVRNSPRLDALLDEAFRVEDQGWKGRQGTSIRAGERTEFFYRSLAGEAARRGAFRLYVLRWNGRIIAFDYCLARGRTLFALKTGYDQSAASFSAGNLMRRELLRTLFADREFVRYDFLGPVYPWKMEWNAAGGRYEWFYVYPPDWRGRVEHLCRHGWKNMVKCAWGAAKGGQASEAVLRVG